MAWRGMSRETKDMLSCDSSSTSLLGTSMEEGTDQGLLFVKTF
ncbi:hypothetical protein [Mucilaginibacter sp.]